MCDLHSKYRSKLQGRTKVLRNEVRVLKAQLQQARKQSLSRTPSPDINSEIRIIGSSADVVLRSSLVTRESMLLDPINAVKKTVLGIIQYFNTWVDLAKGDFALIGKGDTNPFLVALVNSQFCEALSCVFAHGFEGPFYLFATPHPWHMFEELIVAHQKITPKDSAEMRIIDKLLTAMNEVGTNVDERTSAAWKTAVKLKKGGVSHFGLSYQDEELKLRALIIKLLNEKSLSDILLFLVSNARHDYFWNRFYRNNALLRTEACYKKVIEYIILLSKLQLDVDPMSVCNPSLHTCEDAPTRPLLLTIDIDKPNGEIVAESDEEEDEKEFEQHVRMITEKADV